MVRRTTQMVAMMVLALGVSAPVMMGQMGGAPTVTPGTAVDPAKAMDLLLGRVAEMFTGAAQAMPAEKYGFAPSKAIFVPSQTVDYDGARTFVQIVTHTAQANYFLFNGVGGVKPEIDPKTLATITDKDAALKALADSFAFARKAAATTTVANAFQTVRGMQTPVTLVAMDVGHVNDEYGQLVEYLRMNGITPPASVKGAPRQ
jgi:hypothetical protein